MATSLLTDRQSLRENSVCMAVQIRGGNDAGMAPEDIADTIMALVDQMNALESSATASGCAMQELIDAYDAVYPTFEEGKEAQDAWSERRVAAKAACRAILAKGETNGK